MVENMFFLGSDTVGMGGMFLRKFTISIKLEGNKLNHGEFPSIFPLPPKNIPAHNVISKQEYPMLWQ